MTNPEGSIGGDILFAFFLLLATGLFFIVWRSITAPDGRTSPHGDLYDEYPTRQDVERRMRSAEGNGAAVD